MEKKTFTSLVMGVLGGLLFGIGMCMCLLPEWNAFTPGVVVTALGAVVLLVLAVVLHKMSGKGAIKPNWRVVGKVVYGVLAALVLGLGMCMIMVFEGMMIPGIIVGVVGILLLLGLIPLVKGLK